MEFEVSRSVEVSVDGRAVVVSLLRLGADEGMTVAQAAELFGVDVSNIRHVVRNHGLLVVNITHDQQKALKEQGVIPLKTTVANWLPRETLRQLVRHIGTPQADAAYSQLWAMADDTTVQVTTLAEALMKDPLDLCEYTLNALKAERTKRLVAEAMVADLKIRQSQINNKLTAAAMGTASNLTQKVKKLEAVNTKLQSENTMLLGMLDKPTVATAPQSALPPLAGGCPWPADHALSRGWGKDRYEKGSPWKIVSQVIMQLKDRPDWNEIKPTLDQELKQACGSAYIPVLDETKLARAYEIVTFRLAVAG